MATLPESLQKKLDLRKTEDAFRILSPPSDLIDFASNDYLGFAESHKIADRIGEILKYHHSNGSTGSRLITGNHSLYPEAEQFIADFHQSASALIFNSGYDANLGFFSSIPQRGDVVLYDEYCHASIRDGIALSKAHAFKFPHNDIAALEKLIVRHRSSFDELYIATESIFSMDGDSPDLAEIADLSEQTAARLVVDEAHAVGCFGSKGEGLIAHHRLADKTFARIITFGKALGCHGAAVLGSDDLRDYLVNFARSFIYSTALPPHAVASVLAAYQLLASVGGEQRRKLETNISHFTETAHRNDLQISGEKSPIQTMIISGNETVKSVSQMLASEGFDVRPILSPTVPKGSERLRICIHSFNTKDEISSLISALSRALSA